MLKVLWSTLLGSCLCGGCSLFAQEVNQSAIYAESITPRGLKKHLSILASDEYEGRETARKGQKMAAKYIENHFRSLGLIPMGAEDGFQQSFPIKVTHPGGVTVKIGGKALTRLEDFYNFFNGKNGSYTTDEVLYLGYGIDEPNYNDYEGLNVKDKIILVSSGEPKHKGDYWIGEQGATTPWSYDFRAKAEAAGKKGAKAMFIIDPKFKRTVGTMKSVIGRQKFEVPGLENSDAGIPIFYLTRAQADVILKAGGYKKSTHWLEKKIQKKKKPISVIAKVRVEINVDRKIESLTSENVIGVIEGTDKKDELLILSAHYDHLGIRGDDIFNGADDDGSGTVTLLQLAEAFAEAKKNGNGPRRSIMFLSVSGEEKGLYGSGWYVQHPTVPLSRTVANLNIDMIGRTDPDHGNDSNYVYVIGADKLSTELHDINELANRTHTQLKLDYKYNDENDPNRFYYRSDHYNFAKNGIPVIFYFTGTHKDYHKPTDTYDKIMYGKMSTIGKLIFHTAWALANRDKRIKLDKPLKE